MTFTRTNDLEILSNLKLYRLNSNIDKDFLYKNYLRKKFIQNKQKITIKDKAKLKSEVQNLQRFGTIDEGFFKTK